MINAEWIREWYRGGGRLQLPVKFGTVIESGKSGKVYRVVLDTGSMSRLEFRIWWQIRQVMEESKMVIDVGVGRYHASVNADWFMKVNRWVETVRVAFWVEKVGGNSANVGVVSIEWDEVVRFGYGIYCSDAQEMERAKMLLEHLKLEIEERLNGLLERELFK
jgi:hypothetical protein